jgi:hypothetical protein
VRLRARACAHGGGGGGCTYRGPSLSLVSNASCAAETLPFVTLPRGTARVGWLLAAEYSLSLAPTAPLPLPLLHAAPYESALYASVRAATLVAAGPAGALSADLQTAPAASVRRMRGC